MTEEEFKKEIQALEEEVSHWMKRADCMENKLRHANMHIADLQERLNAANGRIEELSKG